MPSLDSTSARDRASRRRPASAKSEQRVRDIVRIGRDVFSARGYDDATTTEIAERLGISEATIFTYFSSKRDLCARVIEDWYDEIVARIAEGMPRRQTIRNVFAYLIRAHLRLFLVQGTGMCALVLSEGRSKAQPLGTRLDPLQRRYTAPLMDLLARGQASGEVRTDVPLRLMRSLIYGPMEHILWDAIRAPRPLDLDTAAEHLVGVLWPMLQTPRSEVTALRRFRRDVTTALDRVAED